MKREISELESKVRGIVSTQDDKRKELSVTDEAYERLKGVLGSGVPMPKFELTQVEKLGLFDSILECLESGDDNINIAKNVVQCFEDKLHELDPSEKEEIAQSKGLNGPVFRRSR